MTLTPLRFAPRAGLLVAALVAVASLGGIVDPATYARETEAWRAQGIAQDWVDLVVAVPWIALAAIFARRGSRRATLLLGGGLAYAAYSFAIYAFAVHFNLLFLVYVAVLGLSIFGLVDLGRAIGREPVATWFDPDAPHRFAGGVLAVFAGAFAILWLAQILRAMATGSDPAGLAEVGLVSNPVHVLDLAIVLPLMMLGGLMLRRGRNAGYVLGTILLGFSALMALVILVMSRGPMVIVFSFAAGLFAVLLALMLRSLRVSRVRGLPMRSRTR